MRDTLAPIGLNLLFLFAGVGICAGLGAVGPGARSWLAGLGLSYMTGVAATCLLLVVLLVAGVPFRMPVIAVAGGSLGIAGLVVALRRGRIRVGRPAVPPLSARALVARGDLDRVVVALFVVILAVVGIVGLRAALVTPLDHWDSWSLWTRKAEMLTTYDTLRSGVFAGDAYGFMHLDYPLFLPVLEATFFRAVGVVSTQAVHAQLWLLLIGFVWAAAGLVSRVARPVVWAPLTLGALLFPGVIDQLLSGYADVPGAIFLGLGALLLGGWLRESHAWQLALAALMLGAAANVKNEALMAAGGVLAAATAVLLVQRNWRRIAALLGAWAALVLAVVPWRAWLSAHDISGEYSLGRALSPSYLSDHYNRVQPSIDALNGQLLDESRWLYVVPIAVGVALVALLHPRARALASFFLVGGLLGFAGLVWAYWISPNDLTWQLGTSAYRVVVILIFLAVAGLLQVCAALDRPRDPPTAADA